MQVDNNELFSLAVASSSRRFSHQLYWESRFQTLQREQRGITLVHCYSKPKYNHSPLRWSNRCTRANTISIDTQTIHARIQREHGE